MRARDGRTEGIGLGFIMDWTSHELISGLPVGRIDDTNSLHGEGVP